MGSHVNFKNLMTPGLESILIAGSVYITGSDGTIRAVSGSGVKSGSTNQTSTEHMLYLGDSAETQKYYSLVASSFNCWTSGTSSTEGWKADLTADMVQQSGTLIFATKFLSASVTAGTITATATAPTTDMHVDFFLFFKDTDLEG